jgi:hypothetical protein
MFIAVALSLVALPAASNAQTTREFNDSWFWGVKGGVSTFSPSYGDSKTAATYGLEWLITRSRGALYVSADQANVNVTSSVFDPSADNSLRDVSVDKLRRVGFAALVFPKQFGRLRPYGGLGVTLAFIGKAYPLTSGSETEVDDDVFERVDSHKSMAAVMGMAGVQAQFNRVGIFGQASYMPGNKDFLLSDALGFFEFGVRYNLSTSRGSMR